MPREALNQGAADWINLTGEPVSYRSARTGQVKTINATLEQDVSATDDEGMIVNGLTLNLLATDVPQPGRDDVVTLADGRRLHVDMILDSPGHFVRVFVSPE
jgi:hypothetical protein